MDEHMHSKELIEGIAKQFAVIISESEQSVYLFLEDSLKVCNKNFSDLLGYDSPEEWAGVQTSFPQAFVAEASQEDLVVSYQEAMSKKIGTQAQITWKRKDGKMVKTEVILVPVAFDGHLFALHFVTKK
jgi:hypothetical protein